VSAPPMNHVRLVLRAPEGRITDAVIEIDGVRLQDLTSLRIECSAADQRLMATFTARVYVEHLEVEGEAETLVNQSTMSDVEALERAMMLLGETDGRAVLEALIQRIAELARR